MTMETGRDAWEESHIPGFQFADLPHELRDLKSKLCFMLPSGMDQARASQEARRIRSKCGAEAIGSRDGCGRELK
ncbi:MAG TPA: hypothetical protein QGF35_09210 [Dehalococcoidia bacterium]|nr:hypothetical protein [Dehalococcoidia bacterium]